MEKKYWIAIVIVLVLVIGGVIYWREKSKSNNTGKPGAPVGVTLSAVQGSGSCSDWADVLSWSAPSAGTPPITYSWSIDDGSTVVASGTTSATSVTLGPANNLAPSTEYTAVVTATNQWGSAASDPVSVTTGGVFAISGVSYMFAPSGELLVVAESNSAVPTGVLAVSMTVNGGSSIPATDVFYDQGSALVAYLLAQMQGNAQYVALIASTDVTAAQVNTDWQAFNRSANYNCYLYGFNASNNVFQTVFSTGNQPSVQYSAQQMMDPTETLSLANLVTTTTGYIYVGGQYALQQNVVGTYTQGELCAGSAGCTQPTLGAVFSPVSSLGLGDSISVTITAGNANTGVCTTVLPPYTIPGVAPGTPTGITWV